MQNQTIEKEVCKKCGVDVRENTQFCYNCGNTISIENIDGIDSESNIDERTADNVPQTEANGDVSDPKTKAALDDLAAKFTSDEPSADEKLANAAEQRRKARVVKRQPKQYKWEPADDMAATRILVFSLLIAGVAGIVVLITIFWR